MTDQVESKTAFQDQMMVTIASLAPGTRIVVVTGCRTNKCAVHLIELGTDNQHRYWQVPCAATQREEASTKVEFAARIDWNSAGVPVAIRNVSSEIQPMVDAPNGMISKANPLTIYPVAGTYVIHEDVCVIAVQIPKVE